MRRVLVQRKVVARRGNRQHAAHAQLLVHIARSATAVGVELHAHHVGAGVLARFHQRVRAGDAVAQVQVDVRTGCHRRQGLAFRMRQLHQVRVLGRVADGLHAQLKPFVREVASVRHAQASAATTLTRMSPMASMVACITSPGTTGPTPSQVPVMMTSPGYSV
ncbi:hypothetical protein SDC9_95530 [bioreactor metagenome]|uniref:Uncharacterized protein n=1 Tax=bioreactor metagenome TaxID=1076179 RepID=A0A645AD84_9ZZZZ